MNPTIQQQDPLDGLYANWYLILIQLAADPAFAEFDIPDMIEDINDNIFEYGRTKLTNENVAFGLMEEDSEEALALLQILITVCKTV